MFDATYNELKINHDISISIEIWYAFYLFFFFKKIQYTKKDGEKVKVNRFHMSKKNILKSILNCINSKNYAINIYK
jgi:hypothetical protein